MDIYIMANIKLPLKINKDGTYETMTEYIEISFSNFEGGILEKKEISDESLHFNELISKIMIETKKSVRKNSSNLSFKSYPKTSKRFTMKKYD